MRLSLRSPGPSLQRVLLAAVALALPAYSFACSDDDTGATPSPTPTTTSTVDGSTSTPDAGPPADDACSAIASACHPYDLGAGKQHDCHELAEGDDPSKCAGERTACLAACSAAVGTLETKIQFAAFVGTQPFACGTKYPSVGANASPGEPLDLRFYVTDVKLINEAGQDVPVTLTADGAFQSPTVALVDLEDKKGACDNGTTETNNSLRGTVPFGKYKGIAFTIGCLLYTSRCV